MSDIPKLISYNVCDFFVVCLCRQNSERVAAKFVENEFEKADRLMELFFQYHNTLRAAMHRIKQREDIENDEIDEELRAAGQFVVQQVHASY